MNVVFFCRRFYPLIGGVEKHVLKISEILIKRGYRVTVITENYQSLPLNDKFEGIDIIRLNVGEDNKLKKFRIWFELLKYIKIINSADVIHCHDIFFWYLPFRFIFPLKKAYTTFHGYEGNNIPSRKSIFMHKLAEKLSFGNICIGGFFAKWYGTNSTFISYGAVDKKLISESLRSKEPTKEAMFLGRLEKETGIMEYLKAVKDLKIQLDVFGNGKLEEEAKEYVKKYKLKVYFKGFVANATDYIKDYRYLFVSRYLGILEGMALKKPIFAEYNNIIKKDYLEMSPFASFISISKNYSEIIKSVDNYLNNKSNIDLNAEYNWVKGKTWENLVTIYLKLWKSSK